jgi:caffeoyl-CoA O-methyltransferase
MPDQLISDVVSNYLDWLVPDREPELLKMEAYALERSFPIIGPACGHFCYQITRMIKAKQVFEMGSGFGYSTAWFAKAVNKNGGGTVHHVVWDEALSKQAREHMRNLGLAELVTYHVAEAIEALEEAKGPFDLIFNDINKDAYPASLDVIEEKLRPGGLLIIDNMLWSGRIFDPDDHSPATDGVRETTRRLAGSKRWVSTLVPIRDGLMIAFRQ